MQGYYDKLFKNRKNREGFTRLYIIVDRSNHHQRYYLSSEKTWERDYLQTKDFLFFDTKEEAEEFYQKHFRLRKLLGTDRKNTEILSIQVLKNVYIHDIDRHDDFPLEKKDTAIVGLRDRRSFFIKEAFHPKHKLATSGWYELDSREYEEIEHYSILVINEEKRS